MNYTFYQQLYMYNVYVYKVVGKYIDIYTQNAGHAQHNV